MEDHHEESRRRHGQGLRDHRVGIALVAECQQTSPCNRNNQVFTSAQVGIDTHVTGSSAQALSFSIGNVLLPGRGKHCQILAVPCELLLTSWGPCIALPYQSQLRG